MHGNTVKRKKTWGSLQWMVFGEGRRAGHLVTILTKCLCNCSSRGIISELVSSIQTCSAHVIYADWIEVLLDTDQIIWLNRLYTVWVAKGLTMWYFLMWSIDIMSWVTNRCFYRNGSGSFHSDVTERFVEISRETVFPEAYLWAVVNLFRQDIPLASPALFPKFPDTGTLADELWLVDTWKFSREKF